MRKFRLVLIILVVVLGSIALIINWPEMPEKEKPLPPEPKPTYSDDPATWIEEKGAIREISVDKITKGASYHSSLGQQYDDGTISTAFDYEGFYKGSYFRREYKDEDGNLLMRITPEMSPTNGIIEGFIVEKIEDNKPIAYIFLDEDWKQKVGTTYIFWGATFQNERIYDFKEVSKGVYMEQIEDDSSRFTRNYKLNHGGIIVGDITPEKKAIEDPNVTAIKFI